MKALSTLIDKLKNTDPDQSENLSVYENLLAEVVALKTPDSIAPLLTLFNDDAEYHEVMFSIIHSIEVFDSQTHVREILRAAPALCSQSPYWASIIFMRMLNFEPTRLELAKQLRNSGPDVKVAVKSLMEKINASSVQFLPKTLLIIVAAS
jgi:hypothetical protein